MPSYMRYACSIVAFVDGGLPFGSLVFGSVCLVFRRRFRSRSSASDLADAGRIGWNCQMRPVRMKRPLTLFTAFLKVFSACSTVLVSPASARY